MPSRLSAIFRSVLKVFNCTRKPKKTHNWELKIDKLNDIPVALFPCYKLPLDVQEQIVRSMDTYEMQVKLESPRISQCPHSRLQSSLVSPRFRVAARLAKPELCYLSLYKKQVFNSIDKPVPTIILSQNRKEYHIKFFWLEQKDQLDFSPDGRRCIRIREDLRMAVVGKNINIYNSNSIYSKLDDYQFIFDIIFRVFTVDCFNLGGEAWDDCLLPKKHKFPLALRYRNLVQYFKLVQNRRSGTCADLTSDELSALLDNLNVTYININWNVEPGTKYTGKLKTKRMKLHGASWLTFDQILTMDCEVFSESETHWTAPDFITIVRKWQEGGLQKLKMLKLKNCREDWDWAHVLDEFDGTRYHRNCKEILRNDGKKAKVFVYNDEFFIRMLDEN